MIGGLLSYNLVVDMLLTYFQCFVQCKMMKESDSGDYYLKESDPGGYCVKENDCMKESDSGGYCCLKITYSPSINLFSSS